MKIRGRVHFLLPIVTVFAFVMAPVLAVIATVMYVTADSAPELSADSHAPGEQIEVPGAMRWDGMALWGQPADIDLDGISCGGQTESRSYELPVGPSSDSGEADVADHPDGSGEVVLLASTASVLARLDSAGCEGPGLERVFVSPGQDVAAARGDAGFFLAGAAAALAFGIVGRWASRRS